MTKQNKRGTFVPSNGYYFWLGDQGELFDLTPEEFEKRQREWKGPRPSDYIEGL